MSVQLVFAYPIRPWKDVKLDAAFLDPAYRARFGAHHPGVDWNLRSGGDSDLGKPVYSLFPGTVVGVGWYRVWGNNVLVRAEDWVRDLVAARMRRSIKSLELLYAHLHHVDVEQGQTVQAGECLGSIGKGDPAAGMAAHLHFEARTLSLPINDWPGGSPAAERRIRDTRLNPHELITCLTYGDRPNLQPSGQVVAPAGLFTFEGAVMDNRAGLVLNRAGTKLWLRCEKDEPRGN